MAVVAFAANLLAKYADDTYLIVSATNVDSCALELDSIEKWSKANSLALNRSYQDRRNIITDREEETCLSANVVTKFY